MVNTSTVILCTRGATGYFGYTVLTTWTYIVKIQLQVRRYIYDINYLEKTCRTVINTMHCTCNCLERICTNVIVIIIFYSFQERKIHLVISQQIRKIQTKELQQKCREIYTILRNKHSNEQNILHRYEYCKQNSLRDILRYIT